MKNRIIYWAIPALLVIVASVCNAQSLQQNAASVSSGGAIVNGNGYDGNVSIGTLWLAHDMPPADTLMTVSPQSLDFGSVSDGHDSLVSFSIMDNSTSSLGGVSISGNVGQPTNPNFTVQSGAGPFTLSEGSSMNVSVLYSSPRGKGDTATMTITGPREQDEVIVHLDAAVSGVRLNTQSVMNEIFPNPSTGEFTIQTPNEAGEISRIDLLDEAGHVVADLTRSVVSDADGIHVKSGGLAAGTYFVRVEARGGEYLYKIVIDHGVK